MDIESVAGVGLVALLSTKLVEAIIYPIWDKFTLDKFWLLYVGLVFGGLLGWFTPINVFPMFEPPVVGKAITCLACGLGSSFVYDIWLDKPAPPES